MSVTSPAPPPPPPAPTGTVAARAVNARKVYGSGDTVVNALAGVTVDGRSLASAGVVMALS